jgi:hypothetical protein
MSTQQNYCLNCQEKISDGQTFCRECRDATAKLIEAILSKRRFMSRKSIGLTRILR